MKLGDITRVREITPPRQFEVLTGTSRLRELEGGTPREHRERALFTIDEATGSVTVASQYGNYAYQWTSIGSGSLASFLCSLDMDYFMEKAAQQSWRELDCEATIKALKNDLIERRREGDYPGGCSKETSREVWDGIEQLEGEHFRTTDQFFAIYSQIDGLYNFFPPYDVGVTERNTAQANHFWNVIWKAFTGHLRKLEGLEEQSLALAS